MKVALVANTTWNIYNFRLNIIDKLLEEGHEVVVIAPIDEYIIYKENYPEVTHVGLRTLDRDGSNPLKDLMLTLELARKYKRLGIDLVIHYTNKPNIYGGFASKLSKTKSIAIVTGLGFAFLHEGFINTVTKMLYRLSAKYHSKVIFENNSDRHYFKNLGIISSEQGYSVKGCGVDLKHFSPSLNGVHDDQIIFSFIGRLLYDKGIREFVEAAKKIKKSHPRAQFWVIGELDSHNPSTIDREELNEWIQNDVIEYHGFKQDIRPLIKKSNCVVLPSYREGLPRTILEGMAMGKAIITTDTPGCNETVEEGHNGYLVEAKNVQQLAEAMTAFLSLTNEERLELGKNGRQKAEKEFDSSNIANDIYEIIFSAS